MTGALGLQPSSCDIYTLRRLLQSATGDKNIEWVESCRVVPCSPSHRLTLLVFASSSRQHIQISLLSVATLTISAAHAGYSTSTSKLHCCEDKHGLVLTGLKSYQSTLRTAVSDNILILVVLYSTEPCCEATSSADTA